MDEKTRLYLNDQFPPEFIVDKATDFPDTGCCKVRGYIGKYGIVMEWDYINNPTQLYLETRGIDNSGNAGPCDLDCLKKVLEGLI